MRRLFLMVAMILLVPMIPTFAEPAVTVPGSDAVTVNGRPVESGQRVAQGRREGTKCTFDQLEVSQVSDGTTDWVAVRVNDNCQASIVGRWSGELKNAPAGILPRRESPLFTEDSFTEEAAPAQASSAFDQSGIAAAAAVTCTTHKLQIIMYGLGGPADRLTRLLGSLTACENSTTFTSASHTGTCYATDPPAPFVHKWVTERCYSGGIIRNATTAQSIELGDFHCDPRTTFPCNATNPKGYDHTLKTIERKIRGGKATCTGSLTGLDVVASYTDVVQGCK